MPQRQSLDKEECPVPCDLDCEEVCHESHAVFWKREHDPKDCPGRRSEGH